MLNGDWFIFSESPIFIYLVIGLHFKGPLAFHLMPISSQAAEGGLLDRGKQPPQRRKKRPIRASVLLALYYYISNSNEPSICNSTV